MQDRLTKKVLVELYINKKCAISFIVKLFDVFRGYVYRRLKIFGIKRSLKETCNKNCLDCPRFLSDNRKQRCRSCDNKHRWKNKNYKESIVKKSKTYEFTDKVRQKMRDHRCDISGNKNPMYGVHRFGPDAPGYIDGRSYEKYPPEFNDKLRGKIRKRDNYECKNCGMTDEEHLSVYGRHIEVHHIDYNRQNCRESNLIVACKPCNIRFNKNRNYWKKYLQDKINNGKTVQSP